MSEHDAVALVQQALAALARGDLARFVDLLSPHAAWHVVGATPLAGDYHGRDGILGLLGTVAGLSQGSYHTDAPQLEARGPLVVCWRRATARHDPQRYDAEELLIARVEESRICEVWQMTDLFGQTSDRSRPAAYHVRAGALEALAVDPEAEGHPGAIVADRDDA